MSKVIKKRKGTVSHYDDDSFEFSPYGKGEPVYDHSYKVGVSTLGLTKGAGKQNYIAHLKCKIDEAAPQENKATITVCSNASKNKMKILWT